MTELNIWNCDKCEHTFNPKEYRWSNGATATGRQLCAQCARPHNTRAKVLNFLRWE